MQARTKLRKSLKDILNCCKLQIVFKSQNKLAKAFRFKDRIPKELNVRIGEHIGISPLTQKKVKPKGSAVNDHLLLCNHPPSFENFSVLTKENEKKSYWN